MHVDSQHESQHRIMRSWCFVISRIEAIPQTMNVSGLSTVAIYSKATGAPWWRCVSVLRLLSPCLTFSDLQQFGLQVAVKDWLCSCPFRGQMLQHAFQLVVIEVRVNRNIHLNLADFLSSHSNIFISDIGIVKLINLLWRGVLISSMYVGFKK